MFPASSSKPTTSPTTNSLMVFIKCCWAWCWEGQGPLSCMPTSPTNVGGWQLEWSTDSLRDKKNIPVVQAMQCATQVVVKYTMTTMSNTNAQKQVFGCGQGMSWGWRWTWDRGMATFSIGGSKFTQESDILSQPHRQFVPFFQMNKKGASIRWRIEWFA